jgi:nucleotide-binding universal stress UspA family protein
MYLASLFDATLKGLCIIDAKVIQGPLFSDISGFIGLTPSQDFLWSIEKGLDERALSILEDFSHRCCQRNVSSSTTKTMGLIDETIIEESKDADLIILAQRGEHFKLTGGGLMGSTAESVVKKSGKPVFITPYRFQQIHGVGLAYDGSDPAFNALKLTADILPIAGWTLTVIIISEDMDHIRYLSEQANSFLKMHKIESTIAVRAGKEEQELIRFIEEGSIQLLIMGAYGKSRIKEFILGSTTASVIRKSTVPVLMVK